MTAERLAEILTCLRRELALRRRVYPRWVAEGRMTAEKSAKELELMSEACDVVEKTKMLAEVSDDIKAEMEKRKAQEESAKKQTEMEL